MCASCSTDPSAQGGAPNQLSIPKLLAQSLQHRVGHRSSRYATIDQDSAVGVSIGPIGHVSEEDQASVANSDSEFTDI